MKRLLSLVLTVGCGSSGGGATPPPKKSPAAIGSAAPAPTTAPDPGLATLTPEPFAGAVLGMTLAELQAARPRARAQGVGVLTEAAEGDLGTSYVEYRLTGGSDPRLHMMVIYYDEELDARAHYDGWKVRGREVMERGGRHVEIDGLPYPVWVVEGTLTISIMAQLPGQPAFGGG